MLSKESSILFLHSGGTAKHSKISLLQLSVFYTLTENSLCEGKILDNRSFMKLSTNQNFGFVTLTRLRYLKH